MGTERTVGKLPGWSGENGKLEVNDVVRGDVEVSRILSIKLQFNKSQNVPAIDDGTPPLCS